MRIDAMLTRAGWVVQDYKAVNLYAGDGVAVRELPTASGPADYVLFVNRQPVGVIEAKKVGTTLAGVEWQTVKYQISIPDELPAVLTASGHLPFGFESTGDETWFTCRFDPEPTARRLFWFHRPEALADMVENHLDGRGGSLRARVHDIDPLPTSTPWLRTAQHDAITNLEASFRANKPRALIQMATGSGKTFAACNIAERLITRAERNGSCSWSTAPTSASRPSRSSKGSTSPATGRKFTELYNVQHLASNTIDPVAKVCIGTIQRVYSILRGEAMLDPDLDEMSTFDHEPERTVEVDYNERCPDRGVRRHHRRRVPPLDLRRVASGARVLRRLPRRPHRHTRQADLRVLQPEPRHGVRIPARPSPTASTSTSTCSASRPRSASRAPRSRAARDTSPQFRDRETRKERLETVDDESPTTPDELDKRGRREGSDPHHHPGLPRQPARHVPRSRTSTSRPARQHPEDA